MKRIIYILIMMFFLSSSFLKEKSLKEVLIGNCWVNKSYESDDYVKRLNFHPNKDGLKFINEIEVIVFKHHSWCSYGGRNQLIGVYDFLNDSTVEVRYRDYNETTTSLHYRVRKKRNIKVEIELLSFQERLKGDNPKPFLD